MSDDRAIDPRLRRMIRTQDQPRHVARDIRYEKARRSAAGDELETTAESVGVTTSVLVELSTAEPPQAFKHLPWGRISERIWAVDVPVTDMQRLAQEPGVIFIEASRRAGPTLDDSVAEIKAAQLHNPPAGTGRLDGTGVIVGIVDSGFDFTLADFRHPDGKTRVAYLWDQSLTPQAGEASPAEFGIGVEYDRAKIDQALASADPFTLVRHHLEPRSHGTHVAGIAAGNGRSADANFPAGRFVGVAPGSTIIFVQHSRSGGGNFTDSVNLARAVSYIYQRADQLGMPCVINMSLGTNGGSHDGESLVERGIDGLLQSRGRAFVKSAGNMHTTRCHASGRVANGSTRRIAWEVREGDMAQKEIELWYKSRDRLRVRVATPSGKATPWVAPGEVFSQSDDGANPSLTIEHVRFHTLNGDALVYIELVGLSQALPHGNWIIEIEGVECVDGRFDAWIERDDYNPSQFFGIDFDPVRTLSLPGTLFRGITVANYDHSANPPVVSGSSGRGPTRDGRMKPEIAAPGTRIVASCSLGGRTVDGELVPVRVSKSGTSMAAPHVAGAIALLLQKDPRLTAAQIRGLLIAAADRPPNISDFNNDFGFGRLNIKRALDLLTAAGAIA